MAKLGWTVPVVVLGAAAALLVTINGCWTSWEGGSAEQETNDAFVRADMAPLSTRVSGTVRKMGVSDFETVKAGQLLVELNDDDYRAILEQAKAALAVAQAAYEENQATCRTDAAGSASVRPVRALRSAEFTIGRNKTGGGTRFSRRANGGQTWQ